MKGSEKEKSHYKFVYFTEWNENPLERTNKLWPGWNATLIEKGVHDITSISKFPALQLTKFTNFILTMYS